MPGPEAEARATLAGEVPYPDEAGAGVRRLRAVGAALQSRISRPSGWVLAGLVFCALQLASAHPGSPPSGSSWLRFLNGLISNGGHAFAYGVVAFCAALGMPRRDGWPSLGTTARRALLLGVFVAGLVDELHQAIVPARNFSVLDLLTDVVGAAVTLAVIAYVGRSDARAAGLRARLWLGCGACLAAALLATLGDRFADGIAWL
jgi:hypothetical protein